MNRFVLIAAALVALAAPARAETKFEREITDHLRRQSRCIADAPGVGATMAEVERSCLSKAIGSPRKTRSTTARGVYEVWRYHTVLVYYFENGVVVQVTDLRP